MRRARRAASTRGSPSRELLLAAATLCAALPAAAGTVTHSGNITADTTWPATDVHLVTGDVTVDAGVVLTIEPGTVVKFDPLRALLVNGALDAQGTATDPIVLTSYRDDSVGGDTNGGSAGEVGAPGDWRYLRFYDTVAEALTHVSHVEIRYGGSGSVGALRLDNANVDLDQIRIAESASEGLYLYASSPAVTNSTFEDGAEAGVSVQGAGSPLLSGNVIRRNQRGLDVGSSSPVIQDNAITDNRGWGIWSTSSASLAPPIRGNTITGNARAAKLPATAVPSQGDGNVLAPNRIAGLWVLGRDRATDLTLAVLDEGTAGELRTYVLEYGLTMTAGTTLTLEPGVVVKGKSNAAITIEGALSAAGTADAPIVLTSIHDDRFGGDTNDNGYASRPAPGDWKGIEFTSTALDHVSVLEHVKLLHAGATDEGALYSYSTHLALRNAEVANSGTYGIRGVQAQFTLENVDVYGNGYHGLHIQDGPESTITGGRIYANLRHGIVFAGSASGTVTGAEFFANGWHSIVNTTSSQIDARGCWWGAPDGPGGDGPGSGDSIEGDVLLEDFFQGILTEGTDSVHFNAGPNVAAGTLPGPVVAQGTDTSEWGPRPWERMLFDLDTVVLDWAGLDPAAGYELFVTYYNPDQTAAAGGSVQRLTDGGDPPTSLHGDLTLSETAPEVVRVPVPPSLYGTGDLRLAFERENGYRATVSQVVMVEVEDGGDSSPPVADILAPLAGEQLGSLPVEIRGTVSDAEGSEIVQLEVGIDGGSGVSWRPVSFLATSGSWLYRWSPGADGPYTLHVRARDAAGNSTALGSGVSVVVNDTPPAAAEELVAYDTPADAGGSVTLEWLLSADDGAGADDVTGYDVERAGSPAGPWAGVGTAPGGATGFADATATTGTLYHYRVVAVDQAGNRAEPVATGAVASIDNLGMADGEPPEEVTDLTATAGNAYVRLTWTPSLDSAGDLVEQLLDVSTDGGVTWGSEERLSKGVTDHVVSGLTNGTAYRFRLRVRDSASPPNTSTGATTGDVVPAETASTAVSGSLSGSTEWVRGNYTVTGTLTIPAGASLTVEPGSIVKLASGARIDVLGSLYAEGTPSERIVFTALADDSHGGDTNGDGPSSGEAGDWNQIEFESGAVGSLRHVVVRYGGSTNGEQIRATDATLSVTSSEVLDGANHGIRMEGGAVVLEDSTLARNVDSGVYVHPGGGTRPVLRGNTFSENAYGVYVNSTATATIDANTFSGNTAYGLFFIIAADNPQLTDNAFTANRIPARIPFAALFDEKAGNTFSGNTRNHLEVIGNTLARPMVLAPSGLDAFWQVNGNAVVAAGASLRMRPGIVWKMDSWTTFTVQGALWLEGTESEKVVFTSYRDDSIGGNTNWSGDGQSGEPGDWRLFDIEDSALDSLTQLHHAEFRYGGGSSLGAVRIRDANPTLDGVRVAESASEGLWLSSASPVIQDSIIEDNGLSGVWTQSGSPLLSGNVVRRNRHGLNVRSGDPVIQSNTITDNTGWGIYSYSSAIDSPPITGNTITGNARAARLSATAVPSDGDGNVLAPNRIPGLWIVGRALESGVGLTLSALDPGTPQAMRTYVLDGRLVVPKDTTLTIQPGVVLKGEVAAEISVDGALSAVGSATAPIVLTSVRDDHFGGDTNNDGYGSRPAPGDWDGIVFNSIAADGVSVLEHVKLLYAGTTSYEAALYSYDTDLALRDSEVAFSSGYGIRVSQAQLTLENAEVYANTFHGVHIASGQPSTITGGRFYANLKHGIVFGGSASGTVTGAELFANGWRAMVNSNTSEQIDARGCWWGAPDGPGGDGPGSGNWILGDILLEDESLGIVEDGPENSKLNVGPNSDLSFGIPKPIVSGESSSEWGGQWWESVTYDFGGRLTAEYTGLVPDTAYELFAVYLNQDPGSSVQTLKTAAGKELHGAITLPGDAPRAERIPIPADAIVDGNLELDFEAVSGLRAVLSGLILVQQPSTDADAPLVTLDQPANGASFAAGPRVVRGTAQDGGAGLRNVEVSVRALGLEPSYRPVTQLDADGGWLWNWTNPSTGDYEVRARAVDRNGNVGTAPSIALIHIDTAAPGPVTGLLVESVPGGLEAIWTPSVSSDVVAYDVLRRTSATAMPDVVGTVASGSSRYTDTTAELGVDYWYAVRAVDGVGNAADSALVGPVQRTDVPDTTAPEDVTDLAAVVTSVSGSEISAILTWTGSANSEGDLVGQRLRVSRDGGATSGSNAPLFDDGQPIELGPDARRHQLPGLQAGETYTLTLHTYDEVPNESVGVPVTVSPTGAADQYATLGGMLAEDLELGAGVYRVSGDLQVPSGAVLRLAAGTVLKFDAGSGLLVDGRLEALGTAGSPVVFTAWADDAWGGDSNGDGPSSGAPGDWLRIQANPGSSVELVGALVRYSGSSEGAVHADQASASLRESTVEQSGAAGVYASASSVTVENGIVRDNAGHGIHLSVGGSGVVTGNRIERNDHGIYSDGTSVVIEDDQILDNAKHGVYFLNEVDSGALAGNTITGNEVPLRIPASALPDATNVLTPNTRPYIRLLGSSVAGAGTLRVWDAGTPDELATYLVCNGSNDLVIPLGSSLTIEAGVVVKLCAAREIRVEGMLVALGSEAQPVHFTSWRDASAGLDVGGGSEAPQNGDWDGIAFFDSVLETLSTLHFAVVRYGGGNGSGNVYVNGANVNVESTEISNSSSHGIRVYESAPRIIGSRIWGSWGDGVHVERVEKDALAAELTFNRISSNIGDAIDVSNTGGSVPVQVVARNNQLFRNRGWGLRNTSGIPIDASGTWWGDLDGSGPFQASTNPAGTGERVGDDVDYGYYVEAPPFELGYANFREGGPGYVGVFPAPLLAQGVQSNEWDPTSERPDRTMAHDASEVVVDWSGLDPAKRYRVRTSYFNGDPDPGHQSMDAGVGSPVHASQLMPTGTPVQYEYPIAQGYHPTGDLTLRFVNDDDPATSRAAATEMWILEDLADLSPPRFESARFNDTNGDGVLTVGDQYVFGFSEALDTSLIVDGTGDADARLVPEGGSSWGAAPGVAWSADARSVTITLDAGFTVTGSELVTPVGLLAPSGSPAVGSQLLSLSDTVRPNFVDVAWVDADASGALSLGDAYVFRFDEAMDTSQVRDGETEANTRLRPEGWARYGSVNQVAWSADAREVTVTVTEGYSIRGDEVVTPTGFVTDVAGNSVQGSQSLAGREMSAPELVSVSFEDADGSGSVSLGDSYRFAFSEPMVPSAVSDGTTEANFELSPGGALWGDTNDVSWSAGDTQLTIGITPGFTVVGNEVVEPGPDLTDLAGNALANTIALTLVDTVAPSLAEASGSVASPVPPTGSYRVQVRFSSTMDAAVTPTVTVTADGGTQPAVPATGTWSATVFPDDTFTTDPFSVDRTSTGQLHVGVSGGRDRAMNPAAPVAEAYAFVVQDAAPVITSHPLAPAVTDLTVTSVTLAGDRNATSAIRVNGAEVVPIGDGPWSANLPLVQGTQDLVVVARDALGNDSEPVTVRFFVDSMPPSVAGVAPANGARTNAPPASVVLTFSEPGSGLDVGSSTLSLSRDGAPVNGSWSATGSQLGFTPVAELADGSYFVSATLVDAFGHVSAPFGSTFAVDRVPPPAPGIDPLPEVTNDSPLAVTGTKEAGARVVTGGAEVVGHTPETTWSYSASLASGENELGFLAIDEAGNLSPISSVTVTYDDVAPGPVPLAASGSGDGTTVALSWTGYDEAANGNDIAFYRVYQAAAPFADATAATQIATVEAGTKTYTSSGLAAGEEVHYAVVAFDLGGNADLAVTSVAVTPQDTEPPEDVTGLRVASFADRLVVQWNASNDSAGDLDRYHLYFDGAATPVVVGAGTLLHEVTGLAPATGYPIRVTAVDTSDNESAGATITGVTWLDNPTGLAVEPFSGRVTLSWTGSTPAAYVASYRVYAEEAPFASVSGLTPRVTVAAGASGAGVAGLTNGTPYHFAVTAVNVSGGERDDVVTVSATPQADSEGPELTSPVLGAAPLVEGLDVSESAAFGVSASDPSGVGRVEFWVDGARHATDVNGADGYGAFWDIVPLSDGPHAVEIRGYDTLDNLSTLAYTVDVALGPPGAPTITAPADGLRTNDPALRVEGTAESGTDVRLYRGGVEVAGPVPADAAGGFAATLTLAEGANAITATAENRGGIGPASGAVTVELDTAIPEAPAGLSASAREAGEIHLSWNAASEGQLLTYDVYRSSAPFALPAEAARVNASALSEAFYSDLPATDGTYYYRVVAVNDIGSESAPSNQASAESDSTPPRALSIEYATDGAFDPDTGRFAPGAVDVTVTLSEPLLTVPFLSIAPTDGLPLTIELAKVEDTVYRGSFAIEETTPSGTAYAVFSARDRVGNRGTEIDAGATLELDTDGPAVTALTVNPADPILNDELDPVEVVVTLELSEEPKAGSFPELSYLLSGAGRVLTPISTLAPLGPTTFEGYFTLPADAGLAEIEMLSFVFLAVDDLDNAGTEIAGSNDLQVYQGELPPLEVPTGLTAVARPAGQVELDWNPVEGAAGYQLHRQGPGETELAPHGGPLPTPGLMDSTPADGTYLYAVSSLRQVNGQEAESAASPAVSVVADATPPAPPESLALELVPQGIHATWAAPAGGVVANGAVTYSLYRDDLPAGVDLDPTGLTPIETGIPALEALDASPDPLAHAYAATAVDEAGNESVASNTVYLNFDLLPLATLAVDKVRDAAPVVSWSHPSTSIDEYRLSLETGSGPIVLQQSAATSFADLGYDGEDRTYSVVAIDGGGAESASRSVLLPAVRFALAGTGLVERGVFNALTYDVTNAGSAGLAGLRLRATLGGRQHLSEPFGLAAGETAAVSVVVGGYEDLSAAETLTTALEQTPNPGESVRIVRDDGVSVADSALFVSLETRDLTRGSTGQVRFALENTSDVETEIVVARQGGSAPSNEIRFKLLDGDDNVLAVKSFQQATGTGVVSLSNGSTVARVAPGATFTADWYDVEIPAGAPDEVRVVLEIDRFHYELGETEHAAIEGHGGSRRATLVDTDYAGALTEVSPSSSFGGEPIVLRGQAVDSVSGALVPNVPLRLVLRVSGYERSFDLLTGGDGLFEFQYVPEEGESGIYSVSVLHPDRLDRPEMGQFVLNTILVGPTQHTLRIPRNFQQTLDVTVRTGEGTTATNARLEYLAEDQPLGVLPAGVQVGLGGPIDVAPNRSGKLSFTVSADNSADDVGSLVLRVLADETGTEPIARVNVGFEFTLAQPALFHSPSYVETGVARDDAVNAAVTLENRGLAPLTGLAAELLSADGSPPPEWAYLTSPAQIGTLEVGETARVDLVAAPLATTPEGYYDLLLRVTADNHATRDIQVVVAVSQSGAGSVLFHASDIYTATLDANGVPIPGLAGARIKVQHEELINTTAEGYTDAGGELLLGPLPAGRYTFRASAPDHTDVSGRFRVFPDTTSAEEIFLVNEVITVEWSVEETTIEDRYEIVLTATYETDVPVAVVVLEPAGITLPDLREGDVYYGELTASNHGLIRAQNVIPSLPDVTEYMRFDFLTEIPDTLEAGESVTIPYRITALQSFDPAEDGDSTGGGGCTISASACIVSDSECQNGQVVTSQTCTSWTNSVRCGTSEPAPPSQPTAPPPETTTTTSTGTTTQPVSGGFQLEPALVEVSDECSPNGPCPPEDGSPAP